MKISAHPAALVPIGASDRPGFYQLQSEIETAAQRAKAGALLAPTVMLRGQIVQCIAVFAELENMDPAQLLPLFHPYPGVLKAPRLEERQARREHLMFLARLHGYPDARVAAEFSAWEAAHAADGLHYNDACIGLLEQILVQSRRVICTGEQAQPLASALNVQGFDSVDKFSSLGVDLDALTWRDILELRREPAVKRFQTFIARRLPGAPTHQQVIEEWDAAQSAVNLLTKPSSNGKPIHRIMAQLATGAIPNPYGLLREAYGYNKERAISRAGGHVYFVLDARQRAQRNTTGKPITTTSSDVIDEVLG